MKISEILVVIITNEDSNYRYTARTIILYLLPIILSIIIILRNWSELSSGRSTRMADVLFGLGYQICEFSTSACRINIIDLELFSLKEDNFIQIVI